MRVVCEIGRGRFGVVYKAWWMKDTPRLVALKILTVAGDMEVHRFDREISVLQRIESPHIVKCLHAGESAGSHYFVMDYVRGTHLDEFLRTRTTGLPEKLRVFQRVCSAVADAHATGVIHRDLKPRNILVDDAGAPHILDFGICSVYQGVGTSMAVDTITQHGDVIGTLKYMSPEQAWGGVAGPIDARSDIWSLGIMLYEIATGGKYPYPLKGTAEKSLQEVLLDDIRRKLPRPPNLEGVPDGREIETLIERCLMWEATQRIPSVRDLARDVRLYLAGERIQTRRMGLGYRVKRLAIGAAARSRWSFAAAFVAFVAVLLWGSAHLFNVGWFESDMASTHSDTAPTTPIWSKPIEGIVIVGLGDDSIPAIQTLAAAEGLTAITDNVTTWRGLHAHTLRRLATAHPSAIVWDYYFRSPQQADEEFASAIRDVETAGIPVVLAAKAYDVRGMPDLSSALRERLGTTLRHGAIVARDMVHCPGEFVVAIKTGTEKTIPSLALVATAAVRHPETYLKVDWDSRRDWVRLMYEFEPGAYHRDVEHLRPTSTIGVIDDLTLVSSGDTLATVTVKLHEPQTWLARSISYQELLSLEPTVMEKQVRGRIVLFGDLRHRRDGFQPDRHSVRFGTRIVPDVPGCYLLADAITGLLAQRYQRAAFPPGFAGFLAMLLLGTLGCTAAIRLAHATPLFTQPWRAAVWCAIVALTAGSYTTMLAADTFVSVAAGMSGVAFLLPFAGMLWVEMARNRHRILDHNRQVIEGFGLDSAGTLTVSPTRD